MMTAVICKLTSSDCIVLQLGAPVLRTSAVVAPGLRTCNRSNPRFSSAVAVAASLSSVRSGVITTSWKGILVETCGR